MDDMLKGHASTMTLKIIKNQKNLTELKRVSVQMLDLYMLPGKSKMIHFLSESHAINFMHVSVFLIGNAEQLFLH